MIHDKREFGIGLLLMAIFLGGLALVFSPLFENGKNALDYMDGVFNSISKASAYFIPASIEKAKALEGAAVSLRIEAKSPEQASRMEKLLGSAGATVAVEGTRLGVSGDLGRILGAALADADAMFGNDGVSLSRRYGFEERRVLFAWHAALSEATRDLNRQERFREAAAVRDTVTRSLEPAYNYYGVTAIPMKRMIGIAFVALVGYVVYTVWYGYAILFLFEGWGLKLEH
jgi:hypothetical protein